MSAPDWRQAELEATWFAVVEEAERLKRETPRLSWAAIAEDHFKIGESTLRYWRKRYWQAKRAA
jgi:hypothetical protein